MKKKENKKMKYKILLFSTITAILFYQCDPTKKLYKSEEYSGEIDTISNYNTEGQYDIENGEDYDYGDYEGEDYSYDENFDTATSKYSQAIYEGSAKRFNDLLHTKLEMKFDWQKAWMYGKATLTLKPYFYPTSTLVLDAKGMEIQELSMITGSGKMPLKYLYNTDSIADTIQITIDLGREFKRDEQYQIFIDYISKPNELSIGGSAAITSDKGLYFINNDGSEKDKPKQIWTQGETEATSCWCPTIDKPNERCTNDFYITIEDKYQTLSNGTLITSKKNADGTRTDNWKMDQPHAPYLFMIAIGEFAIIKDTWKNIPVNYYVDKEYAQHAKAIFGNTPEMLDFYSNKLGVKYVWPKYSQIIVHDYVSGAMENTTATIHGEFLQQTTRELLDESNEDVISHELFHQWFGDLVTCESWSNLPLNESFATYGEYLWREYKYGRDDADYSGMNDLKTYLDEAAFSQVDLIRFNYETREDMFDSHSYAKGGRVLHMLRKYLGDEAFYAGLNKYLEDNKYTSVEIHNLRLAMEAVSGEDLNWFFNEWFLSSGHPDLGIYYQYNEEEGIQIVTIQQYQDTATTPIYVIPLDIDIYYNGKVERKRVVVDKQIQDFVFETKVKPDLINVDAEKMLLGVKSDIKTNEEYIFQYNHAPLFLDRMEAVQALSVMQYELSSAKEIIIAALNDKHWAIRQFALDTVIIENYPTQELKDKIISMAKNDPKSYVRASAIAKLQVLEGIDAWAIYNNALNDSSYAVISTALNEIYNNDPKKGLELARNYKKENNYNLSYTVLNILGKDGDAIDNDFFIRRFQETSGFESYFVMINYEPFLKRMNDSYIIIKGVDELKEIAKDEENFWMSFTALGIISGLLPTYQEALANETNPQIQKSLQASIDHINVVLTELNPDGKGDY